jgi:hypothetical protein
VITGALVSTTAVGRVPLLGDQRARQILYHICRRLDGSRELLLALTQEEALPAICVHAIEHRLTPRALIDLEALRRALDGITAPRWWDAEAS